MTITVQSTQTGSQAGSALDLVISTNLGTDPAGVLVVASQRYGDSRVSGCDVDGTNLTAVTNSPLLKTSGEASTVHAWFGEVTSTGTVNTTLDVTATTDLVAAVYVLNADGTLQVENTATIQSDSVSDPAVTLALNSEDCFVAEAMFSGDLDPADTAAKTGWTIDATLDFGSNHGGVISYDTIGSTDVTAGFDQVGGSDDANVLAVAISEVGGSSTALPLINAYYG